MADYAVLRAEVTGDPLGRGYAGMTDQAVADSLNALTEDAAAEPVPRARIKEYLIASGRYGALLGDNAHASAAAARVLLNDPDFGQIDTTHPAFQAIVASLVADGLVSLEDVTAVSAMGVRKVSRASQLAGWSIAVQAPDVAKVRAE